ncbi:Mgl repressor and galactose ultrainduction factor [Cronobacter sakazakii]|nr:Mgl repressor and galactose ultrainduction factor [Cronobacter sakazakii]
MVTLEDVAAHAGVSRATVSRVVNGDTNVKSQTRARVEAAIQALGYSPNPAARALASSQSHTIGLVTTSYRGGFFGALMDTVQSEAQRHGKQLLVTQGRDSAQNERDAISQLYNLRCDGLLLHVRMLEDDALRAMAAAGDALSSSIATCRGWNPAASRLIIGGPARLPPAIFSRVATRPLPVSTAHFHAPPAVCVCRAFLMSWKRQA